MLSSKLFKSSLSLILSFLLTQIPSLAAAQEMIPAHVAVADFDRSQAELSVRNYLQEQEVKEALLKYGVSAEEASSRLASLSESEMRDLSSQVKEARAGGDILITVLVVVLIIYFIKRI